MPMPMPMPMPIIVKTITEGSWPAVSIKTWQRCDEDLNTSNVRREWEVLSSREILEIWEWKGESGRNQKDLQRDISKELGMELNNCFRCYWRQMWMCSSHEKTESLTSRVSGGNRESKMEWTWRKWNDNSEKCLILGAEEGLVWFISASETR
jgi:hypothetical protein